MEQRQARALEKTRTKRSYTQSMRFVYTAADGSIMSSEDSMEVLYTREGCMRQWGCRTEDSSVRSPGCQYLYEHLSSDSPPGGVLVNRNMMFLGPLKLLDAGTQVSLSPLVCGGGLIDRSLNRVTRDCFKEPGQGLFPSRMSSFQRVQ